jgi:gentisate 1,2-dioxygenase
MAPGDLVLRPNGAWHDHGNETDHPVVRMDGLDVPLGALREIAGDEWA